MAGKVKYDFICSLGGNCAAAHNLRYRGLRLFSLPFDWLYVDSAKPIGYLAEGFNDGFKNFCKRENLIQTEQNPSHAEYISYYDTYTQYHFVNHFRKEIATSDEYSVVNEKNSRRISRLCSELKKSKRVLFILSLRFETDILEEIIAIQKICKGKFPQLRVDFYLLEFNCAQNTMLHYEDITIAKYTRDMNLADYESTNGEWSFLDEVEIKQYKHAKPIKIFIKALISLIPFKKKRKELRKKYHVQ